MIINCTWFAVNESKCWCAEDTDVIMVSINEGLGHQWTAERIIAA